MCTEMPHLTSQPSAVVGAGEMVGAKVPSLYSAHDPAKSDLNNCYESNGFKSNPRQPASEKNQSVPTVTPDGFCANNRCINWHNTKGLHTNMPTLYSNLLQIVL